MHLWQALLNMNPMPRLPNSLSRSTVPPPEPTCFGTYATGSIRGQHATGPSFVQDRARRGQSTVNCELWAKNLAPPALCARPDPAAPHLEKIDPHKARHAVPSLRRVRHVRYRVRFLQSRRRAMIDLEQHLLVLRVSSNPLCHLPILSDALRAASSTRHMCHVGVQQASPPRCHLRCSQACPVCLRRRRTRRTRICRHPASRRTSGVHACAHARVHACVRAASGAPRPAP